MTIRNMQLISFFQYLLRLAVMYRNNIVVKINAGSTNISLAETMEVKVFIDGITVFIKCFACPDIGIKILKCA